MIVFLAPFLWMVYCSFKTPIEIAKLPPNWLQGLTLDNYKNVLSGQEIRFKGADGTDIVRMGNNLSTAFLNSVAVAVPATIIPILIAAFAAYGFAWMKFPGRKFDSSCFTGEYVTGIDGDYFERIQQQRSDEAKKKRRAS